MSEEQAQQLLYQLQMLETYYADLTQREATLVSVLREASLAIESLKSLGVTPNSETLVPIGLGTFVKANISSSNKIILNVGAGVAIEKDKDSGINFLESRLKEIEIALQDNSAKKSQIEERLEAGKHQMNQMMQQARSKQQ